VTATVTCAVPFIPSLVAVIVEVPAPAPVTTPVLDTVAAPVLLEAHVTMRPVRGLPRLSIGVAVSVAVAPLVIDTDAGDTLTLATGSCDTSTFTLPFFLPDVAVTVVVPTSAPVTTPVELTVATLELLVVHVIVRPESVAPVASRKVTEIWSDCCGKSVVDVGTTSTVSTACGVTVIVAVDETVSDVAVIVVVPSASAV